MDGSASVAKAFSYWSDHKTAEIVSVVLLHVATVMLVFFGAGLRSTLRGGEGEESTYSAIALGGSVFAAVGFSIAGLLSLATATAADQGSPAAVYALNQLVAVDWVPFAAGLCVMMLAVGVGGLRTLTLLRALSWVAIALRVLFITPFGWAGFLILPFWTVAASVVLYRGRRERGGRVATAGASA